MAYYDEVYTEKKIDTSRDNIIIRSDKQVTLRGGRTLKMTGYTDDVVYAGTPIIKETATGDYKPLGNDGTKYVTLPVGHEWACINNKSILANDPHIGAMIGGTVNYKAAYFKYDDILDAVQTAFPDIHFYADKD